MVTFERAWLLPRRDTGLRPRYVHQFDNGPTGFIKFGWHFAVGLSDGQNESDICSQGAATAPIVCQSSKTFQYILIAKVKKKPSNLISFYTQANVAQERQVIITAALPTSITL